MAVSRQTGTGTGKRRVLDSYIIKGTMPIWRDVVGMFEGGHEVENTRCCRQGELEG